MFVLCVLLDFCLLCELLDRGKQRLAESQRNVLLLFELLDVLLDNDFVLAKEILELDVLSP